MGAMDGVNIIQKYLKGVSNCVLSSMVKMASSEVYES